MLAVVIVSVGLLGDLEVRAEAGRVGGGDFGSRKARQVFALLALADGRTVSKDEILDTVWRRRMPQNPSSTVEVAMSLARAALKPIDAHAVVITEPGGYRLDTSVTVVDVVTFDELVARASRMREADRVPALREALALVRGTLLQDEVNTDWVHPYRDRYRQRVQGARLSLARAALALGDAEAAVRAAESAWMGSELVLEEAYAVGVRGLVASGRMSEARALHAAALRRVEVEEAREPGEELRDLVGLLRVRPTVDAVSVKVPLDRSLASIGTPPPFVGRADELSRLEAAVRDGLSGEALAVEVVGPTGMGKSRLLDEVAARVRSPRVLRLQCLPGDAGHPLLAASRFVRAVALASGEQAPSLGESVASLFGRFAELLDRGGPVALLVDDLHLADAGSSAVLQSLVAPGGAVGLCLVATSPVGCLSAPPAPLVLGPLAPFTEPELAPLGPAAAAAFEVSGGNPTLLALAAADAPAGALRAESIAAVERLVSGLPPGARAALASVAGRSRSFLPDDLSENGAATNATDDLVREAVSLGVLRRTRQGRLTWASSLVAALLSSADHGW